MTNNLGGESLAERQIYLYTNGGDSTLANALTMPNWENQRILAFSPHSDDLSIGAGGLLTMLARRNHVQPVLGFTGWRGVGDDMTKNEAIQIREAEMREEAKILGMEPPLFLQLLSYEEQSDDAAKADIESVKNLLSDFEPAVLLLPDQQDQHPRHAQLTAIALAAVAQLKLAVDIVYYETPWSMLDTAKINLVVPLEQRAVAAKNHAISAHESQLARNDFLEIAKAMMILRAYVVPELLGGLGESSDLGRRAEVYSYQAAQ